MSEQDQAIEQLKENRALDDAALNYLAQFIIKSYAFNDKVKWIDPIALVYFTQQQGYKSKDSTPITHKIANAKHLIMHDVIFIPVHSATVAKSTLFYNRSTDNSNFGHWSLLIYFTKEKKIYHFDSYGKKNVSFMQRLVYLIAKQTDGFIDDETELLHANYIPEQNGGWQCGYVLLFLVNLIMEKRKLTKRDKFEIITESEVNTFGNFSSSEFCNAFANSLILKINEKNLGS